MLVILSSVKVVLENLYHDTNLSFASSNEEINEKKKLVPLIFDLVNSLLLASCGTLHSFVSTCETFIEKKMTYWFLMSNFLLYCCLGLFQLVKAMSLYKVGVGIADVTGPAAEINMVIAYLL
jgi:hypothetical protein